MAMIIKGFNPLEIADNEELTSFCHFPAALNSCRIRKEKNVTLNEKDSDNN